MTERITALKKFFVEEKGHHAYRLEALDEYSLAEAFAKQQMPDMRRATERLKAMLTLEEPVIFPEERLVFTRRNPTVLSLFTKGEIAALQEKYTLHERGEVCNISVDYTKLLDVGFLAKKEELCNRRETFQKQGKEAEYLSMQIEILDSIIHLCDRYAALARMQNQPEVAARMQQVSRHKPQTLPEALQMFRILHFIMWLSGSYHNVLGRLDQLLYPYYQADMAAGRLTAESALEWVEEFFLTFNRDSDLYYGMQQGDNGQSLVLGGLRSDGTDSYNELSELCLKASLSLSLIDPKINLRVNEHTPLAIYELGSELTKQSLGFPQYANDDVVIPALLALGYAPEDAYNYVVAACWEFIIPGKGMDIPNLNAVSFAQAVQETVEKHWLEADTFDDLMQATKACLCRAAKTCIKAAKNLYLFPAPYLSLMMEGCVENGQDISLGGVYNNFGFHGTGIATAVDSLAAIRKYVYKDKSIARDELLDALRDGFVGHAQLQAKLRYDAPKMGNNDAEADDIATVLMDTFADALEGEKNERGGIFRAGTGSAMYYVWHAKKLPATADGRNAGENLPANYAPSLFARINSPLSILQSFAKPHLQRLCNGGPLTLELHDTLFRNEEAVKKVALMVKSFMTMGGHQLQLNAVNRDKLLDAQIHPEEHRGLIVRVWGWSGYFVELDKEYQDHIISRMELTL